ncbi:plasmid maintenance system killer protein [Stenotrophomonas sp. WZN-1]|uniref:type II toxin-antitoxin system RelE/ParE family toxin n=1 Tax=unclassified Stenotrophomonas TaxID=196198 RepID=UPI000B44E341|nr:MULTISPECIES: plasmid maintenance system killer protein [unclassified Stenotrophomonas]ARZ75999.1 plasmid maintenance system killer protein [Stenotrophomonas sp. WZN-1]
MIRSFRCKQTRALFEGTCPRAWRQIRRVAERKLQLLDSAQTLAFLRSPPDSLRINDQWRLCFIWTDGGADAVEIVDYH